MVRALQVAVFAAALLGSCLGKGQTNDPFCYDENNSPVYWWVAVKKPGSTQYLYMDNQNPSFTLSKHDMSSTTAGALAHTMKFAYEKTLGSVFFNSQPPDGTNPTLKGEGKGVYVRDSDGGGFWMVHSANKFPNSDKYNGYSAPASAKFGQTFMCVSLLFDQLETSARQLLIDQVHVYRSNLPNSLSGYKYFSALASGSSIPNLPTSETQFYTLDKTNLTSFARSEGSGLRLYEDMVSAHFHTGLLTETYRNGPGGSPSFCKPTHLYDVNNIIEVKAPDGTTWKETVDHSKWAVSGSVKRRANTKIFCVGDMNRKTSQTNLGGGALCIEGSTAAYDSFYSLIGEAHVCH